MVSTNLKYFSFSHNIDSWQTRTQEMKDSLQAYFTACGNRRSKLLYKELRRTARIQNYFLRDNL